MAHGSIAKELEEIRTEFEGLKTPDVTKDIENLQAEMDRLKLEIAVSRALINRMATFLKSEGVMSNVDDDLS